MPATAFAFRSPVAITHDRLRAKNRSHPDRQRLFRNTAAAPPNGPAFSRRVESSSVTRCVRAASVSPGSLNPTCPLTPIPSSSRLSPPDARDRLFVALAFDVGIGRQAVEAVGPLGIEVDSRQEMLREEPAEAPGVRGVETDEFVEQERRGVREVRLPRRVETAQLGVRLNRRSTGRQAEDEIRALSQRLCSRVERAPDSPPLRCRKS